MPSRVTIQQDRMVLMISDGMGGIWCYIVDIGVAYYLFLGRVIFGVEFIAP